jgi:hypothetical protein
MLLKERTDDVEILDAVYQERKFNDIKILRQVQHRASQCGNHKMTQYLENEISVFNKN